jgi:hypothetical protein
VVKLVEHPISIRQAFWSPYKRIVRMIQEQVQNFAASRDQAVEERVRMSGVSGAVANGPTRCQKGAPQTPFDIAKFAGIFAAIGLAIGAIGTVLAAVVAGLFNLVWWQLPAGRAGRCCWPSPALRCCTPGSSLAQAQSGTVAGRQRLGRQHPSPDQPAVRHRADRSRRAASRVAALAGRSLRGEEAALEDCTCSWLALVAIVVIAAWLQGSSGYRWSISCSERFRCAPCG